MRNNKVYCLGMVHPLIPANIPLVIISSLLTLRVVLICISSLLSFFILIIDSTIEKLQMFLHQRMLWKVSLTLPDAADLTIGYD
ncbi:MAG: hypothetical protein ABW104_07540 [Candidatus Thiodiazotropha sp. 6PLUC2]